MSIEAPPTAAPAEPPTAAPTARRLVDSARSMLDEQGLDGLTLRAIARRAGVSHGAPLRHFPTLGALLAAVAAQGFRELIAAVDVQLAALAPDATALDRLAASGRGYVMFAIGSPGVFTVMFRPERLDVTDPAFAAAGTDSFQQLEDIVADAQREGFHPDVDVTRLASVMWANVHGLADLWIRGGGLPGADATFGLDEFVALSQSMVLDSVAEPGTEQRRKP
ncbi:MAG: TetR/AcrR family transcriptional regulator [Acidimicrobiia bacterium]